MGGSLPHPFAHGEILESEVLGILECKKEQIEDRPQPIELILVYVCTLPRIAGMLRTFPRWGAGDLHDTKDCRLHQKSPVRIDDEAYRASCQTYLPQRGFVSELHPVEILPVRFCSKSRAHHWREHTCTELYHRIVVRN